MQVFIYLSKTKLKSEFKSKPGSAREISSTEIGPTSLKVTFDPRASVDENTEEGINLYKAITYLKKHAFDVHDPLFVQPVSAAPFSGLAARHRIHRDLQRRYGREKWSPDLPPEDRKRVFIPGKSPVPLERI